MFLRPKDSPGDKVPCLVMRKVVSNMVMATVAPSETTRSFAAERALAFLPLGSGVPSRQVGRPRQPACGSKFVVEASLVGSSGSNCRVERSIQSAQDQVREMRVSLQDRWKVDASHRHAVFSWMLEYEAYLLNWYEVGRHRTAYERPKA